MRSYFNHKCENDHQSYQVCGFFGNSIKSYKNAICKWRVYSSSLGAEAEMVEDDSTPKISNKTVILPSGEVTFRDYICDDRCDRVDCEDEANCNGLTYGQYCYRDDTGTITYVEPKKICTRHHQYLCCKNVRLPWTPITPGTELEYKCNDEIMMTCNPKITSEKNICDKHGTGGSLEGIQLNDDHMVFNTTRCTPTTPLCWNNVDQFNCTDQSRVGVTCAIHGYISTVSKYRICVRNYKFRFLEKSRFCDDSIDTACEQVSPACRVHKHHLCNGVVDCDDQSDEKILICEAKTLKACVRRAGNGTFSQPLPLAWLGDGIRDCMDGNDEKEIWPTCGIGKTRRYVINNSTCENVFLCRTGKPGFVEFNNLCDGIDTCGNENGICKASRGSIGVMKTVINHHQGLSKRLSYCMDGLEHIWKLSYGCSSEQFIFPDSAIFGLDKPTITLPNVKISCNHMFGEQYVYTSCIGKCINSPCPLKNIPKYNSCPGQYPDRAGTIINNKYLTFVVKSKGANSSVYINNIFVCENGIRCVSYSQVCDLVDDCGDGSDEALCTNHFKCNSSGSYIPRTSKCDGKIDCLDLSDECNDECSKELLDGLALKGLSWTIGVLAIMANLVIIIVSILSFKKCRTTVALTNKSLVIMISIGDLLVGSYLVAVSLFDGVVHGEEYCKDQTTWLSSSECSMLGVTSTIGSHLSLLAMTVLSSIRVHGIWNSMRIPGGVSVKNSIKVIAGNVIILVISATVASIPIIKYFDDFFVNGIRYDSELQLFGGLVSKETHKKVFKEYFGRMDDRILSWDTINGMVFDMFSHDTLAKDFTKTQTKVGFYGNDGVCLFKYFIRRTDPQQVFVWSILILDFICFVVISICYIIISILSTRSSNNVSSRRNDKQTRQRNKRMNQRISFIIVTDFLCWVPFIIICMFHYLEILDATPWYSVFSMVILPINSVINPFLYNDIFMGKVSVVLSRTNARIFEFTASLRSLIATAPQENIEMQEISQINS